MFEEQTTAYYASEFWVDCPEEDVDWGVWNNLEAKKDPLIKV